MHTVMPQEWAHHLACHWGALLEDLLNLLTSVHSVLLTSSHTTVFVLRFAAELSRTPRCGCFVFICIVGPLYSLPRGCYFVASIQLLYSSGGGCGWEGGALGKGWIERAGGQRGWAVLCCAFTV